MNLKHMVVLIALIGAMAACKKDGSTDKPIETEQKDTIYLVNKMVTNFLLTPSPVTQTETFTYNAARQLIKHTVTYKSATANFTVDYSLKYSNGKVSEVTKTGTKHYPWKKLLYTYTDNVVTVKYVYPANDETITITLNNKGLAEKIQGNGQYYQLKYDANGNIENRSQYENAYPTKPPIKVDYTYDKKHSPFWAQRNNIYILYQAFNDVNSHINNRISNNTFELYNHTYNADGYPDRMVVVHSSVATKKVDYTYTKIVVDKE